MRLRFSSRAVLIGLAGLFLTASVATFMTAILGIAQQPEAKPTLPDGLRHVPLDAMGFVHFRVGDFLKSDLGKQLLTELRKDREASKGLKKIEQTLGIEAADLDSVTLLMLPMSPHSPFDGPGGSPFLDRKRPIYRDRDKPFRIEFEKDMIKDGAKDKDKDKPRLEEAKPGIKESPVLFQPGFEPMHAHDVNDFGNYPATSGPLVIVTSTKALDRKKILRTQLFGAQPRDIYGPPPDPAMLFLSDRSVMIGMPLEVAWYSEVIARKADPKAQPMRSALALGTEPHLIVAGGHVPVDVRRMYLSPYMPDLRALAVLSPLFQTEAGLTLDFGAGIDLKLQFNAPNDASAGNVEQAVKTLRVMAELALEKSQEAGEAGGWKLQLEKAIAKALADVKIEQKGTLVRAQLKMEVGPAVVKHFSKEIVANFRLRGDRTQSVNNLKQIGLALHAHHDVFKRLPAAGIGDRDGKPLLSWRVAILPFIEQQPLYQLFDLNQPWDHPTNKKLIARMPAIYAVPGAETKEGETNYRVLVGPDTMFPPRMGVRFADVTDGTSNTIMAVEAREATIWTKPDDLPFDPKGPLPKFGVTPDGFNVLFADGSVRFVRPTVPEEVLRAYITRNGGEVVPPLD